MIKELAKTVIPNSGLQANGTQNVKFDIPDVIQYIKTSSFNGANQGYIVCEELLHACLMWADPDFAWDVLSFLTRLRQKDNDYLRKANEELTRANKDLKKRCVPDVRGQQWYYYITYKVEDDTVHIYSQYSNENQWNKARSRMKKDGRSCV